MESVLEKQKRVTRKKEMVLRWSPELPEEEGGFGDDLPGKNIFGLRRPERLADEGKAFIMNAQVSGNSTSILSHGLLKCRRGDGGFGASAYLPSNTECTALATLALDRQADVEARAVARSGLRWLRERQRSDGSWPISDQVEEPSWATAWAAVALGILGVEPERLDRAGGWLVSSEGRRPGWATRLLLSLVAPEQRVGHQVALRGWPWHQEGAAWVEPTAVALMALDLTLRRVNVAGARERVAQGRALLLDRMCPGGGWNYGNARVLGVDMDPFPDTTALALLALPPDACPVACDLSLSRLKQLLDATPSRLALSLGVLAIEAHGRNGDPLRTLLESQIVGNGPPSDARSLALSLLALDQEFSWPRTAES